MLELYCSACSLARFLHWRLGPDVWCICIDRLPRHELEGNYRDWNLAAFLAKPNVVYVQRDLGNPMSEKLELWCKAFTDGRSVRVA